MKYRIKERQVFYEKFTNPSEKPMCSADYYTGEAFLLKQEFGGTHPFKNKDVISFVGEFNKPLSGQEYFDEEIFDVCDHDDMLLILIKRND